MCREIAWQGDDPIQSEVLFVELRLFSSNSIVIASFTRHHLRARPNDYTCSYCDITGLGELKNSGLPVHPQFVSKNAPTIHQQNCPVLLCHSGMQMNINYELLKICIEMKVTIVKHFNFDSMPFVHNF
jgi:hypothetical protein